jgi:uncharacterized membrane protein YecN with MAPEG domain
MHLPSITSGYLAVLALLYATLCLRVVRLRRSNKTAFGDGGDATLRSAIRAQAHFAEYVPITALMVAMLEMSGAGALQVHLLMAMLLVARLLHPIGMYVMPPEPRFLIGRVGGMTLTVLVMMASAVLTLLRLSRGL